MTANYSNNPSGFMRLIAASDTPVGTTAEDLATFFDMTPYEAILVSVTCTGTVTATSVTVKFASSASSSGTSLVNAKDAAGTDLITTIATPASGTSISMWVRTRGLLKFGSPLIATAGAPCDLSVTCYGIAPRDTSELAAGWTATTTATNSAFNAGVVLTEVGFS